MPPSIGYLRQPINDSGLFEDVISYIECNKESYKEPTCFALSKLATLRAYSIKKSEKNVRNLFHLHSLIAIYTIVD